MLIGEWAYERMRSFQTSVFHGLLIFSRLLLRFFLPLASFLRFLVPFLFLFILLLLIFLLCIVCLPRFSSNYSSALAPSINISILPETLPHLNVSVVSLSSSSYSFACMLLSLFMYLSLSLSSAPPTHPPTAPVTHPPTPA